MWSFVVCATIKFLTLLISRRVAKEEEPPRQMNRKIVMAHTWDDSETINKTVVQL